MTQELATGLCTLLAAKMLAASLRRDYGFALRSTIARARTPTQFDIAYVIALAACLPLVRTIGIDAGLVVAIFVQAGLIVGLRVLLPGNHIYLEVIVAVTGETNFMIERAAEPHVPDSLRRRDAARHRCRSGRPVHPRMVPRLAARARGADALYPQGRIKGLLLSWYRRRGDRYVSECLWLPNARDAWPVTFEVYDERSETALRAHLRAPAALSDARLSAPADAIA